MNAIPIETLGKRVRDAREAKGLSGRKLATAAGISSSFMSDVETGKNVPGLDVLQKIAEALELDVWVLAGAAAQDAASPLRTFPLDRLKVSQANPRKTLEAPMPPGQADIEGRDEHTIWTLADNIKRNGLMTPLSVHLPIPGTPAADAGEAFVVDGQRRLLALRALAPKEGYLKEADPGTLMPVDGPPDWMGDEPERWEVPCYILPSIAPATEAADENVRGLESLVAGLVQNYQRDDLTAHDEARAFDELADYGLNGVEIADRIGRTPRHVQMRLKLWRELLPAAREAWEQGTIQTAVCEALVKAKDAESQGAAYEDLLNQVAAGYPATEARAGQCVDQADREARWRALEPAEQKRLKKKLTSRMLNKYKRGDISAVAAEELCQVSKKVQGEFEWWNQPLVGDAETVRANIAKEKAKIDKREKETAKRIAKEKRLAEEGPEVLPQHKVSWALHWGTDPEIGRVEGSNYMIPPLTSPLAAALNQIEGWLVPIWEKCRPGYRVEVRFMLTKGDPSRVAPSLSLSAAGKVPVAGDVPTSGTGRDAKPAPVEDAADA